jgi:hypothetical protein
MAKDATEFERFHSFHPVGWKIGNGIFRRTILASLGVRNVDALE